MRALSLLAVLFLLVMPLAARQMAPRVQANGGWVELCTLAGLKLVKLDPAAPAPPQGGNPHGGDCDYCPLLHSLAAPAAQAPLLLSELPQAPAPDLREAQFLPDANFVGLGSRGPPLT